MKKTLLYISIAMLYLLTPLSIMCALDRMVSLKYEVDENYFLIDGNDSLTEAQKQKEIEKLDKQGRQLQNQANMFAVLAFSTFVTATALVITRKRILAVPNKSPHPNLPV